MLPTQAATERLLVRAYVAYERLAGFADVPDVYTGADALRGCDQLVRLARAEPPPPVLPPVQPAPPPVPVVRCSMRSQTLTPLPPATTALAVEAITEC